MAVGRPSTAVLRHRRGPAARPRGRTLLRPRDWRVRTKLAVVLVIPAVAFMAVAGLQTGLSVRQATALSDLADQVALGQQVTALVHDLQFERDRVSGELAARAAAPADTDRDQLAEVLTAAHEPVLKTRAAFDAAAAPLRGQAGIGPAIARASAALDELALIHAGVEQGWLRQPAVFDGYTRAIEALLVLLRPPSAVEHADVRGYQSLVEAKELHSRIRGQVFAIASGGADPAAIETLADTRAQRLAARDRFRANATAAQLARFDEVVSGQAVRGSARLEQAIVEQAPAGDVQVDPEQWWAAATTELELIREVESVLIAEAHQQVAASSQRQWWRTGLVTGATVLILLVSLLIPIGIGRSMARSLRQLQQQAMDVARVQLPGLLTRLRGTSGAVPEVGEVAQLTAGGADEVGDVADAFTQVHRSAVELAVEQAVMRRNVNSIVVNLARRSQVLVERQLELLDDLEREETEPGQLRNLFRLDHLATRMRRNNESLLVLTGTDTARSYPRGVSLAAVTLAAIAEIEQYQRVREDVTADLHVAGHAVADLVHLLAELLDNATSFSARDTTVTITGRRLPNPAGALVEISDTGLGMTPAALAEANLLLAAPPVIDVAASERMGLVVVGHLAARHGVRVHLAAARPGVRASIWLPESLLVPAPADREPPPSRTPAAAATGDSAGRRAVRAEDVLAGTADRRDQDSTWWAVPDREATRATGTATLPARAPTAVVGGVSAGGLPIRVPLAQLPDGQVPAPAAAGWRAADPDPEDVGNTLSRFYGGVRRAESEAEPDQPRGGHGGAEQGST